MALSRFIVCYFKNKKKFNNELILFLFLRAKAVTFQFKLKEEIDPNSRKNRHTFYDKIQVKVHFKKYFFLFFIHYKYHKNVSTIWVS